MPKKSRQRNSNGKHSRGLSAGKIGELADATYKPWHIAAVCAILVVVTVISYWGVLSNSFVAMDDSAYILLNRHVQQGVTPQSIAWAFTTFHEGNWHPLTWISHTVDWSLYGSNPGGQHMTSVCLHAANAVLLFLLLLYMTGLPGRAAMVAFLFALHPAHVESVAWLAERKDVLCAFFWFAALLGYVWYLHRPSWKRYAWVVFVSACALMSKPMAVTLPLTMLLLDYWPLRRITFAGDTFAQRFSSLWKLCVEKWPFFLISAISCVITFIAQQSGGSVATLQELPLRDRLCNAAISYFHYVRIAFWPNPLRAYYYYNSNSPVVFTAVLSVVALVLVTALCWYIRKERPYCLIGWLWFVATLMPVIGIVQVGHQSMAERYTYVPLIGIFIAVVWLAGDAVVQFPKIKVAVQLLAAAVIVACAIKTAVQVKVWQDTVTLFSHVLEIDPRGEFPNSNLGAAYVRLGNYAEARKYFERALAYTPSDPLILSYSAFCIMRTSMINHDQGNLPLAGKRMEQALHLAPDNPDVLTNMALWSALMGKPKDEEMYCKKLIAAHPDNMTIRLYLGDALRAQDKLNEAAQQYRQVVAADPDNYNAHNDLGMVLVQQGDYEHAVEQFSDTLHINPAFSLARRNYDDAQARMQNEKIEAGRR